MYIVSKEIYDDMEGRRIAYREIGKFETMAEAKTYANTKITKNKGLNTGNWKIIARTIDEIAFSVTDKQMEYFDWYKNVGRIEDAKKDIVRFTEEINKLELSKANCKTETGIARKDKEIAWYKKYLANAEKILRGEM